MLGIIFQEDLVTSRQRNSDESHLFAEQILGCLDAGSSRLGTQRLIETGEPQTLNAGISGLFGNIPRNGGWRRDTRQPVRAVHGQGDSKDVLLVLDTFDRYRQPLPAQLNGAVSQTARWNKDTVDKNAT